MHKRFRLAVLLWTAAAAMASARGAAAQAGGHAGHARPDSARADSAAADGAHDAHAGHRAAGHRMLGLSLGRGWELRAMGQLYPLVTAGAPLDDDSPLHEVEGYLTQGAAMLNLESPGQAWVLRTTLNLEGLTQPGGEITPGGWGEGFLDRRHPHTLVHELMLSRNVWSAGGLSASLSAGKGFAPYGTDDPMSRPAAKYPTNHHLSQVLERWTVNLALLRGGWSLEAGLFGGAEPEDPWDFGNVESFGDSWSLRLARRFGGTGTAAPWEASASIASVAETHHGVKERTTLTNAAIRHAGSYGFGGVYALAEASASRPGEGKGFFSVLGEAMLDVGRHRPYYRVEYASRPEYDREAAPGAGEGFFRYHHDDEPFGATRWLINTAGYALELTEAPVRAWPFVEAQHHAVRADRGGVDPAALFGTDSFWSLTVGVRLYPGGGPMRMGSYGVLDDMTWMHRTETGGAAPAADRKADGR